MTLLRRGRITAYAIDSSHVMYVRFRYGWFRSVIIFTTNESLQQMVIQLRKLPEHMIFIRYHELTREIIDILQP